MRYTLNILIFFILIGVNSVAISAIDPKQEIDSLENKLKSAKGNQAISIINQLADKYRVFNVDKSIEMANEALEKSKKAGNEKEQADALNNLGKSAVAKEKLNEAINYFQWSFDLSNKSKYVEGISKSLNNICFVYGRLRDFPKVEEYHKSLKQHVCLCKSPTKKVRTQSNHIFASIYAFFKLELLGVKSKVNATALRTKLYITANRAAFSELENMKACFDMKF